MLLESSRINSLSASGDALAGAINLARRLTYFNSVNLPRLMHRHGLILALSQRLEAMTTKGMYDRVRFDAAISSLPAAIIYGVARLLCPIMRYFPSDARFFIFRKAAATVVTLPDQSRLNEFPQTASAHPAAWPA